MKYIQTEVLVIGGGATGTGVLRDLAMRGFKCVLVERRDLTHGTTGRYHGLLHSGGRYVVKDPQAARECIEENRILRRIMPDCIEDTGGFFVLTPWDDPSYAPRFVAGCQAVGIPIEEVSIGQMLREEPLLNPQISRCYRVPDGSADSFLAADLNAESARQHGAQVLTYHEVIRLLCYEDGIAGAVCLDLVNDEKVQINADLVVNASGAWAGKIAATADITIQMLPGKGTMLAVNHRIVNTVINRCKMPADGDILVPAHTVAVIGTTDIKVSDPNSFGIEPWEIRLMLEEGEKLVTGFGSFRILRAWAGVRPLFQETNTALNRDVTRAFVLLDHAERDGKNGLLTITSGKWTTYRKMAEVTVNKVCEKLGVRRPCRTHLESLPSSTKYQGTRSPVYHHLGARLAAIEKESSYGQLICECELATVADVERAIIQGEARTIDDIRRDIRLGMGPCQGAFCTYRATGMLHDLRHPAILQTNAALRDFLNERWKGIAPILWGQQLRQERLNQYIYQNVLNTDALPGPKTTKLAPDMYATSDDSSRVNYIPSSTTTSPTRSISSTDSGLNTTPRALVSRSDVLVIGAGLAGLVAAWRSVKRGKKTYLMTKGWGATHWGSGCIDVFYSDQAAASKIIPSPSDFIRQLSTSNPQHPYALIGLEGIQEALNEFQALCSEANYPLHGSIEKNWMLPTALGTLRPTCLAPETMIAGDARQRTPMLIVGFSQFLDFYSALAAENLNAQYIFASDITLDLPSLQKRRFVTGIILARLFDTPEFRNEVAEMLKPRLGNAARVGFPAVLGLKDSIEVKQDLESQLGLPVFEIPGLPPSIPGIRLHNLLVAAIERYDGFVFNGMQVEGFKAEQESISIVRSNAATRRKPHYAQTFILATGGILGGGSQVSERGYAQDTVFDLPILLPDQRSNWLRDSFLPSGGHPLFHTGLQVNTRFQPVNEFGLPIYQNLYAIGGALGSCDPIQERSLEGIALATGFTVGEHT